MRQILDSIPDVDVYTGLEPEELGARLLWIIRRIPAGDLSNQGMFVPSTIANGLMSHSNPKSYPAQRSADVETATIEAFGWLETMGLVIPAPGGNGSNGWRVLSRRAKRFEDEAAFRDFLVGIKLPKELLHKSVREKVWLDFVRGDYDAAVFRAMKQVEVSLREACGAGEDMVGVKLARFAFHPENGPLTDKAREGGERDARMNLFVGCLGSYKNPQSHRHVALSDPAEAIEQILLANHLLRILDTCRSEQG